MESQQLAVRTLALSLCLSLALCLGCTDEKPRTRHVSKRDLIEFNKRMVQRDSAVIVAYSDSLGLNPKPDGGGLWFTLTHEGEGIAIEKGTSVELAYTISDLAGRVYYTSETDGTKKLSAGLGQDVAGLDEALVKMHQGDRATLLLLPDKAYGIIGDENKIRGRRILRYDIEILNASR